MRHIKLKRRFDLNEIISLGLQNKKALLVSVFLFLTGISAGVFLELTMSPEEKATVAKFLQQYLYTDGSQLTFTNPLPSSLGGNLFVMLIIFLSGLSAIGFPLAFIALLYKGLALGFCTGLIIETFRAKGAIVILTAVLPQNMFIIPALLLATSAAGNYAVSSLANRRGPSKKSLKENSGSYISCSIFMCIVVILGCLLEAILYPIVL